MKKHVSLKAMAEDKELDAVGKITNFLIDPATIKVRPGFNPRPINQNHVEEMYTAFAAGASFDPLVVDVEDGDVFVVAGHHRREMYLLARERGHDVKRVEARQFRGTEAERVALTITSQQALPLTPLQLAGQYAKLLSLGWTNAEVASRVGKSAQHIRDTLALLDADSKTKKMLEKGQVSAEVGRTARRQHGAEAGEVLEADLAQAKAEGKEKVTPKLASAKPKSRMQTALDLLGRLHVYIDSLDDSDPEAAKLANDYREFMGLPK